ncbi:MAG: GNAT family N-acetyltransferase [Acidobacteria bacterium]|nr:GNAT family N-acetyltransferase [Acidobacteriota bacterium]
MTRRLIGVPLAPGHRRLLEVLLQDRLVARTLGGLSRMPSAQAVLRRDLGHWRRHGFGPWLFFDRASGAFAGRCGLRWRTVTGRPEVELAYAFLPAFWSRGIASEAASSVVRTAFEDLGLDHLTGFTLTTNRASQRVLEKTGFRYQSGLFHAGLPHVLYRCWPSVR